MGDEWMETEEIKKKPKNSKQRVRTAEEKYDENELLGMGMNETEVDRYFKIKRNGQLAGMNMDDFVAKMLSGEFLYVNDVVTIGDHKFKCKITSIRQKEFFNIDSNKLELGWHVILDTEIPLEMAVSTSKIRLWDGKTEMPPADDNVQRAIRQEHFNRLDAMSNALEQKPIREDNVTQARRRDRREVRRHPKPKSVARERTRHRNPQEVSRGATKPKPAKKRKKSWTMPWTWWPSAKEKQEDAERRQRNAERKQRRAEERKREAEENERQRKEEEKERDRKYLEECDKKELDKDRKKKEKARQTKEEQERLQYEMFCREQEKELQQAKEEAAQEEEQYKKKFADNEKSFNEKREAYRAKSKAIDEQAKEHLRNHQKEMEKINAIQAKADRELREQQQRRAVKREKAAAARTRKAAKDKRDAEERTRKSAKDKREALERRRRAAERKEAMEALEQRVRDAREQRQAE